MALNLYRRRHRKCRAHHKENSYSSELEERRRGRKHCDCTIHLSDTLRGRLSRRATEKTTWEDALKCATLLETAATSGEPSETTPLPVVAPETPPNTAPPRVTVAEAIEVYPSTRCPQPPDHRALFVGHTTDGIIEAVARLLDLTVRAEDADLLGRLMVDEILIRLLQTSIGPRVAQIGEPKSGVHRVARPCP
jgi:hypothetical protein